MDSINRDWLIMPPPLYLHPTKPRNRYNTVVHSHRFLATSWVISLEWGYFYKWVLVMAFFIPPQLLLVVAGSGVSALSLCIYTLCSPQKKLKAMKTKAQELQSTLRQAEDPSGDLIKALLKTSFQHSLFTLLPTLLAILPLAYAWVQLDHYYSALLPLQMGPAWLKGWHLWFIPPGIITSLWIKHRFDIA